MLGGNGGHSGVMCEGSPYIYPLSKVAASQSNSSRIENGVKVCSGCLGAAVKTLNLTVEYVFQLEAYI